MEPSNPQHDWVAPLIEELRLPRKQTTSFDPASLWDRLQKCAVPDRVRQAVARLNHELNDTVLEYLEYLPPQVTVLRVAYRRRANILVMEFVLREQGPKAVFYQQRTYGPLLRYLSGRERSRFDVVLARHFKPEALTESDIQEWLSFLLSGFKRLSAPGAQTPEARPRLSRLSEVL